MNAYLVLSKNQFSQFLFLVMLFHRIITIKPCQDADLKAFRVYPNKGTRSPTGLRLISDTHDGLPTGLKMACDG